MSTAETTPAFGAFGSDAGFFQAAWRQERGIKIAPVPSEVQTDSDSVKLFCIESMKLQASWMRLSQKMLEACTNLDDDKIYDIYNLAHRMTYTPYDETSHTEAIQQ